ncbi:Hypothetical protein FKW44_021320, partial [Caligus rogercresseyi]
TRILKSTGSIADGEKFTAQFKKFSTNLLISTSLHELWVFIKQYLPCIRRSSNSNGG